MCMFLPQVPFHAPTLVENTETCILVQEKWQLRVVTATVSRYSTHGRGSISDRVRTTPDPLIPSGYWELFQHN
jgi:hypothetical protein